VSEIFSLQRFNRVQMNSSKKVNSNTAIIPLMTVSAGVIIANIYYKQPILKEIGLSINTSEAEVGKIAMLSQLGFGLGMFFLLRTYWIFREA
jgi:hypothetical protein